VELRRERVVLRPLAEEDVPQLLELGGSPEVARWWPDLSQEELLAKARGEDDATAFAALVDGEVAGLWRPRKKGKRLVVEVEPLRTLRSSERDALAEEAERLAPFRGAETAELALV
jgi:hypothetical protein